MVYLLTFLSVIVLTYAYEHSGHNKNEKFLHALLGLVIILIPSILGGLRDVTLGTDNLNYYIVFRYANQHSLIDTVRTGGYIAEDSEAGFLVLTWLIARLGDNYFYFAFVTSLITFFFIFEGAKYFRNRFSMTIIIAAYLFIYYCPMYNYVRQGIALAIIFYAFRYAERRELRQYIVAVIFASLIHLSAALSIIIYIVFYLNEINHIKKWYFAILAGIIILIAIGPNFIATILNAAANLGIRPTTLYKYANRFSMFSHYQFVPGHMIRALPQLIIFTICYKRIIKTDKNIKGYYILCWIQAFFMLIGCVYEPFTRNSLYFNYSEFILTASLMKGYSNNQLKLPSRVVMVIFLIGYWYVFTVMNGYGFQYPVFPYVFA